ncbi:hypothetical protein DPMN_127106 [Dreissena polymorpha]|uniref:Uncharacterized protein n=1 Tax=Dreissena polymorpha TaxID=45954 RepID=A0A9D4JYJ4_DREPO|nr:hypothetical protein DPMN_127106 [Dreissena polymorpha]
MPVEDQPDQPVFYSVNPGIEDQLVYYSANTLSPAIENQPFFSVNPDTEDQPLYYSDKPDQPAYYIENPDQPDQLVYYSPSCFINACIICTPLYNSVNQMRTSLSIIEKALPCKPFDNQPVNYRSVCVLERKPLLTLSVEDQPCIIVYTISVEYQPEQPSVYYSEQLLRTILSVEDKSV